MSLQAPCCNLFAHIQRRAKRSALQATLVNDPQSRDDVWKHDGWRSVGTRTITRSADIYWNVLASDQVIYAPAARLLRLPPEALFFDQLKVAITRPAPGHLADSFFGGSKRRDLFESGQ